MVELTAHHRAGAGGYAAVLLGHELHIDDDWWVERNIPLREQNKAVIHRIIEGLFQQRSYGCSQRVGAPTGLRKSRH